MFQLSLFATAVNNFAFVYLQLSEELSKLLRKPAAPSRPLHPWRLKHLKGPSAVTLPPLSATATSSPGFKSDVSASDSSEVG